MSTTSDTASATAILAQPGTAPSPAPAGKLALAILFSISFSHLLNDTIQSLIPAIYPLLKSTLHLNFTQVGLITFTFQVTASLLQPLVGLGTDKRPLPYSLAVGMGCSLLGLIWLANAHTFGEVLGSAALVGVGSSVFHPEASRVAHMASGGQHGFAQSLFQVGGNAGSSLGPLLAALVVLPRGQGRVGWFSVLALIGIVVLTMVGRWYAQNTHRINKRGVAVAVGSAEPLPRGTVLTSLGILMALVFSKYFYLVSLTSYFTFYLIAKFHVTAEASEMHLFIFLAAVAAGTFAGGPIGDRIGRKYVIWVSILGIAPFTLALPYVDLFWTTVLSVIIGAILASAFSAILVYAQELVPGKVGLIAGLFFGLAFGMAGIGAAALGSLVDHTSIQFVYKVCSFLPLIGILTAFLPNLERARLLVAPDRRPA